MENITRRQFKAMDKLNAKLREWHKGELMIQQIRRKEPRDNRLYSKWLKKRDDATRSLLHHFGNYSGLNIYLRSPSKPSL